MTRRSKFFFSVKRAGFSLPFFSPEKPRRRYQISRRRVNRSACYTGGRGAELAAGTDPPETRHEPAA